MINKNKVKHICELAHLKLSEDEQDKFAGELDDIVGYVEKLDQLDTDDVEPTAFAVPMKNVLREDKVEPSLEREKALENAPKKSNGQFKVPPIMNEEDNS
jgi:aspartyl-tRNA(Asn)/glutamyl-tRNA(Gln) amidotransferase subunit C